MSELIDKLNKALGPDQVITGDEIAERATSYWDQTPTTALALLKPRNTREVSLALGICHAHGQAIVTQGGLTGVVEGAVASEAEVILSLERMNHIEAIDVQAGTATVEAGVVLEVLQNASVRSRALYLAQTDAAKVAITEAIGEMLAPMEADGVWTIPATAFVLAAARV